MQSWINNINFHQIHLLYFKNNIKYMDFKKLDIQQKNCKWHNFNLNLGVTPRILIWKIRILKYGVKPLFRNKWAMWITVFQAFWSQFGEQKRYILALNSFIRKIKLMNSCSFKLFIIYHKYYISLCHISFKNFIKLT